MMTRDYLKTYEYAETGDTNIKYFVTLYEVPWYVDLNYRFFRKVDPCSRKPYQLWYWSGLVTAEFRSYERYDKYEIDRIEVSEDWARTHFDWNIDEKEDEQ